MQNKVAQWPGICIRTAGHNFVGILLLPKTAWWGRQRRLRKHKTWVQGLLPEM
jgi:hypothetical protein